MALPRSRAARGALTGVVAVVALLVAGVVVALRPGTHEPMDTAAAATATGGATAAPGSPGPTVKGAGKSTKPTVPVAPPTTRAKPVPATTPTTAPPVPPTLASPPPPPPAVAAAPPDLPPASSWSAQSGGVTVRMTMDPPAPKPGQAVRFTVTATSTDACCSVVLDFGDGSTGFQQDANPLCAGPGVVPGTKTAVATHTFASVGLFTATLHALAYADASCSAVLPARPAAQHGDTLYACVAVGQVPAGKGCRWGPG